jgi:hypothetical protein
MARFFNPIPQYLDGSARVYAGAKIYFYENGTTTPQATYSDAALSVANSNPVVCDSEGRTPPIFVPDDDTYTVVFTDADDVQFASIDDFVGADGNVSSADVVAALAANTAALTIAGASVAITPATTITGALTASSNATVGGTLGVTGAVSLSNTLSINSVVPQQFFIESDAAADNGRWDWLVNGEVFQGRAVNDANSAAGNWVTVNRTDATIDSVDFPGTAVTIAGTLGVNGALSKGSGSFRIDHPLKPKTHQLVHSFVESPRAENLYSGMVDLVNGKATVNIDEHSGMTEGTYEALNHTRSWSSSNESGYSPVKCSMDGNILTIECLDPLSSDTVYFEVRGERKDQHMLETSWTDENGRVVVEPLKAHQ